MNFNNIESFKDILDYNKDNIKSNQKYFDELYDCIKDTIERDYLLFKEENKEYSSNYTDSKLNRAFRSFKEFYNADVEFGNPYFYSFFNEIEMC